MLLSKSVPESHDVYSSDDYFGYLSAVAPVTLYFGNLPSPQWSDLAVLAFYIDRCVYKDENAAEFLPTWILPTRRGVITDRNRFYRAARGMTSCRRYLLALIVDKVFD